jgi:Zn-dependent protease
MTDREHPGWLPPAGASSGAATAPEPPSPYQPWPSEPRPQDSKPQSGLRKALGPAFVVLALLAKFGKGAFVVLKGAKFLTTSASMLVSIAAYSFIFGWAFAVGFVVLLFIHEMGHYIQLRREGVKPTGMVFIPFLGAAVGARSLGGSAIAEARVGLAGPVVGTLAALACIPIARTTGNEFWDALAFTGLFLNLFNLLPVVPLDGGRAMAAMSPWMWLLGLGLVVLLAFTWPNPIIILIALFAIFETYRRFKARKNGEEGNEAYYRVTARQRVGVGVVYLALIVVCVIGMDVSFVDRSDYQF